VNKRFQKLGVAISLAAFSHAQTAFSQDSYSQLDVSPTSVITTPTATTTSANTATTAETTTASESSTATATAPTAYSGGTAAENSKKSSGLQTVAKVGAAGVAVFMGIKCATADPATRMKFCMMAAAAVAATGFLLKSSADTKKASDQMGGVDYGSTGTGVNDTSNCPTCAKTTADGGYASANDNGTSGNGYAAGSVDAKVASQYGEWKSKLAGMGYKVSEDGQSVTLPDGSSKPLSNVLTPQGMASLGMSADEISSAQADMKAAAGKAADSVRAVAMTAQGGAAGGGTGGGGGSETGDGSAGYAGMSNAEAFKKIRDDNTVNGKALGTGSETRGVAADDVFRMVHERYKARDAGDSFLK